MRLSSPVAPVACDRCALESLADGFCIEWPCSRSGVVRWCDWPDETPGTGVWRTGEDGRIEPDREGSLKIEYFNLCNKLRGFLSETLSDRF